VSDSAIAATTNTKVSIGTTLAASDAASFALDTYKAIGGIQDIGDFGGESEILSAKLIDRSAVIKRKGIRDNGDCPLVVARDPLDLGQQALRAAEATPFEYNIKVEFMDKPGPTGTNSIVYFRAVVVSARNNVGGASDFLRTTFNLAISGEIVPVNATVGEDD